MQAYSRTEMQISKREERDAFFTFQIQNVITLFESTTFQLTDHTHSLQSIQPYPLTKTKKKIITLLFARPFPGSFDAGFALESFPRLSSTFEAPGFEVFPFGLKNDRMSCQ